ncbi:Arm DNA-binding domain-containing protein [Comamonas testosteroni]|uniref:Arm DNA-binding domain-containing protein n=1 Tax=Comamonas testosteroni TaxID=285 RepID=UPI0022A873EA|nr:Arm DNA-binding domain-containing protein [Comamonas testosteroni]
MVVGCTCTSKRAGKYWRLVCRFEGKQKTLALGVYPAITLAQARRGRDDARALLAQGIDPSQNKQRLKEDKAVAALNTVEAMPRAYLANKRPG